MPYDVFLSHSSADKPAVEHLARKLRDAGLEPFLDKWHLIPGEPGQEALEKALDESRTCAVFLGEALGPWQNEEMRSALETRVEDGSFRVIPVLLPGGRVPGKRELPRFLRRLTWVDFSASLDDEDAFHRLLAGIRGTAPGPDVGNGEGEPLASYRCMAPPRELFVQRSEYAKVRDALLREGAVGITTAIHGAGGFGKTALATELCYDEKVREKYPDGVLWTTLGKEINAAGLLERILNLIRWWTGSNPPTFQKDAAEAAAYLREILAGRRVLLVVDDVWRLEDVAPFQGIGSEAALLITTRDSRALPRGTFPIPVGSMETSEAVCLLGADLPAGAEAELEHLAVRLGEWPLLLKLVHAQIQSQIARGLDLRESILRAERALEAKGLTYFDRRDAEGRSQAIALSLEASLERLPGTEPERFAELAIFPEDVNVPLAILEKLWGLDSFDVEEIALRLHELSLLRDLDLHAGTIRLHDVIRAYLLKKGESYLVEWNRRLLNAFLPANGRWPDLPQDESYLWNHLIHHLIGAGQKDVCRGLLLDFQYLRSKLGATDINALLADYSLFVDNDEELRLVRDALRLSAYTLLRSPAQLREQLWGRLRDRQEEGIQSLLQESEGSGAPWLRPRTASLNRPGGTLIRTLSNPGQSDVLAVLPDGRVVSGSEEGALWVFDLECSQAPRVWSLEDDGSPDETHSRTVQAIAVLDSHRVISGAVGGILRVWDVASGQTLQVLEAHSEPIETLAVLDSRLVISGSRDKTLRVWDLETGQALQILEGHSEEVSTVAVLDSRRVVSGSADKTLRVWDVETGQTLQILEGHSEEVNAVAVLDSRRVVSGSDDATLRVWDVESGQVLRTLVRHPLGILAVAVLDSRRVVASSPYGSLVVWDVESGQALQILKGHTDAIRSVKALDNRRVVSASADGTLRVWDVESSQPIQNPDGHSGGISVVKVLDSRRVVSGSVDGTLRVWNVESCRTLQVLQGHTRAIRSVAVLDDCRVVSGSYDGALRVWDFDSGQALQVLEGDSVRITTVDALDRQRVVFGADDGTLRMWDLENSQALQAREGHTVPVLAMALVRSDQVITGFVKGTLRVWGDVEDYEFVESDEDEESYEEDYDEEEEEEENEEDLSTFEGPSDVLSAVAVLDSRRVVAGFVSGTILVLDLESNEALQTLEGHFGPVRAVAVLDSRRVVSGADDGTLRVWDLESGQALQTLEGHTNAVLAVAVLDHRRVVSGSVDKRLRVWDLGSGQTLQTLERSFDWSTLAIAALDSRRVVLGSGVWDVENGQFAVWDEGSYSFYEISAVAVLDSRRVIFGSFEGVVWVWDVESSRALQALKGHTHGISSVAVLDSRRIVSSSRDGTLRVWDIESGKTLHVLDAQSVPLAMAVSGNQVIFGSIDSLLYIWDLENEEALESNQDLEGGARSEGAGGAFGETIVIRRPIVYARARDQVISGLLEGRMRLWEVESDEFLPDFEDRSKSKVDILAVLDSRRVVVLLEKRLSVWDVLSGQPLRVLREEDLEVEGEVTVVTRLDSRRVVVGVDHGMLLVWDTESGQVLQVLKGHSDEIRAVAVLDGRRVVSASEDGTLRVWDLETGQALQVLEGSPYQFVTVEVLDSRRVTSLSTDGTLRVWDVDRGEVECLFTLDAPASAIAVLPDTRTIVVGDGWGPIHFFELVEP